MQVLQYVELNPHTANQPWQLLSASQHSQYLSDAAAVWAYFIDQQLAGQQPLPVTEFFPWPALTSSTGQPQQQQGTTATWQQPAAAEPTVLPQQPPPQPQPQQQQVQAQTQQLQVQAQTPPPQQQLGQAQRPQAVLELDFGDALDGDLNVFDDLSLAPLETLRQTAQQSMHCMWHMQQGDRAAADDGLALR